MLGLVLLRNVQEHDLHIYTAHFPGKESWHLKWNHLNTLKRYVREHGNPQVGSVGRELAAKTGDFSSVPGTHMTKRQIPLQQVVLRQLHALNTTLPPIHMHTKLINKYIDIEMNLNTLCANVTPSKFSINSKHWGYKWILETQFMNHILTL